jgi:type IV pilus assembly protein PilQ
MGSNMARLCSGMLAALLLVATPALAEDGGVTGSLTSWDVQESGSGATLKLGASASQRLSCSDFSIAEPPQINIQCAGITIGDLDPILTVDNGYIVRVELAEASDADGTNSEIRVFLTQMYEYDLEFAANGLTLNVRSPDAGGDDDGMDAIAAAMAEEEDVAASSGSDAELRLDSTRTGALSSVDGDHVYGSGDTQVRGVDFQQQAADGISRLIITGSRRLDYETSYPSEQRMVLSIRDAALGTGLERRIDTSQFASAVDGVSAFRSRQTRGEVKVVVDLREAVTPTISEQDNVVLIDFPIPPSIAGAAYDAPETVETYEEPEPEVVDDVQQSAVARERLIGGGGQVLDPAKSATRRVQGIFGQDGVFLGEIDPNHQWRGFPINLNLVNANIHNVFRLIAAVSKLNVVSSDDVAGEVTVQLAEIPWDQALAAVLQAKGLGAMQYGNIIRVAPIETIRKEREDAAAAKAAEVESLPLRVLTLPLNYAGAADVMTQLENMLSKRGSITFDERTNSLIIRDIDRNLSQLRQLVKALDTRTPQVHIEARIVEANSQMSRTLGIQWGGNLNFSPATGAPTGAFFPNAIGLSGGNTATTVTSAAQTVGGRPSNFTTVPSYVVDLPAQSNAGSLGLSLGSLTGVLNLDARLTAGETAGTGRIISAPSITTVTNQSATIRDGARIPYETASLRGTNVQFVEATLLLQVTPQITADGTIFLEVNLTKNRPDFGGAVRGLPTIQIKEAETTVMVADGDTTVIGGVYNFEESIAKQMVPGLGRIPVLGWLFKTSTKREDRRELLVFITPTIVRQLQ